MIDVNIKCPKCGSSDIYTNKKGYSIKKGALGWVITGATGLIAGLIGANKIQITCLHCGHKFKPGDHRQEYQPQTPSSSQLDEIAAISERYLQNKKTAPKVNQKSKCSKCGSINDLGVKFCRSCGVKIDYFSLNVVCDGSSFKYVECTHCEASTPKPGKKNHYCVHCGEELLP